MGPALKPEDWIAHYRVVALLGAGGMGEVYRARDQSLERDVALKVLPPEVVTNEERVRRITQEAKSASSLNHPPRGRWHLWMRIFQARAIMTALLVVALARQAPCQGDSARALHAQETA